MTAGTSHGDLPTGFDGDPDDAQRYPDENPLTPEDLVSMLAAGEISAAEFSELMLEKGADPEDIAAIVAIHSARISLPSQRNQNAEEKPETTTRHEV